VLAITAAVAMLSFAASSVVMPHGEWDAWAIWNLRARFLYSGSASEWIQGFSPHLGWSHPDYPLLVPLSVSRGWTYLGEESTSVPVAIAAIFAVAIVRAAGSMGRERSTSRALWTAAAILASPAFIRYAPSQCADTALAFYILWTVIWISRGLTAPGTPGPWIVAGASAGLAAWTKNEGLLFLAVAGSVVLGLAPRAEGPSRVARAGHMLAGATPALIGLAVLKSFAWQNDVIATQSPSSILAAFADLERVRTVFGGIGRELWTGGTIVGVLPAVALFVAMRGLATPMDPGVRAGLAIIALVILAYGGVYVVTPHDLGWHMGTSLDRVLLHVFPTLVWCGMTAAR
jgi:hypothetical protein